MRVKLGDILEYRPPKLVTTPVALTLAHTTIAVKPTLPSIPSTPDILNSTTVTPRGTYTRPRYEDPPGSSGSGPSSRGSSPRPDEDVFRSRKSSTMSIDISSTPGITNGFGWLACVIDDEEAYTEVMDWQRNEANKRLQAEAKYFDPDEPRNIWMYDDDPPNDFEETITLQDMATAPVSIQYGMDSDDQWVPPPRGTKLSDEGVYMASKAMSAVDRGVTFPVDFDKNEHMVFRQAEN
ncbi:hypothetical protein PENPOL_c028G06624 [Penicillium polonicum]|uniref:Uncharacterized protein n=1 Tax=Penicillium polonicum TaxID=60169 RepID=A0A1V6N683_PENPO|nr:hypothetical protein PENPOL_c028G06624 [Penicillium polonicum]